MSPVHSSYPPAGGPHSYGQPPFPGYGQQQQQQPQQQQQQQQQQYSQAHYSSGPPAFQRTYQHPLSQPQGHNGHQVPPSCYKCGSHEHWAQSCPGPQHPAPTGGANWSNQPRPQKRQKPNGPVITRYPPPPSYGQQAHASPAYSNPPYDPRRGPYGPPTPVSAYSQPFQQWHAPHHHQFQPPAQRQFQLPPQHYPPYGPPGPPTPITAYGSQFPSPVSTQGYPPQPGYNAHQAHYSPSYVPSRVESQAPLTEPPSHQFSPPQQGQPFQQPPHPPELSAQQSYESNGDFSSFEPPPSLEPWEDTSDTPQAQTQIGQTGANSSYGSQALFHNANSLAVWHPADRVERPLPAVLVVAEDGTPTPLQVVTGNVDPLCVSRYFMDAHEVCLSVRDTVHWEDVRDDPVFRDIPEDCELIAVDHILGNRDYLDVGAQDEIFDEEEGELSQSQQIEDHTWANHDGNGWREAGEHDFGLDSRSLKTQRNLKSPEALNKTEMDYAHATQETTEERLARLGVTGEAKPVRAPARPYVQDSLPRLAQGSATHYVDPSQSPTSHIQSPTGQHSVERQPTLEQQVYTNDYRGKDPFAAPYASHNDGYHQSPQESSEGSTTRPYANRDINRQNPQGQSFHSHPPPPPPPPPMEKSSDCDIPLVSEPGTIYSRRSSVDQVDTIRTNNSFNGNGNSMSPRHSRHENGNSRKRSYSQRDPSEDRDREPLRQVDDVTPKLKRRQPKVADAYSRRW
ncbi:MAG: hypothetical protein M1836_006240 [Candelina mexicana]|nr:MAG: hypothetical protein M1836_006240 [Candelina mexicana]